MSSISPINPPKSPPVSSTTPTDSFSKKIHLPWHIDAAIGFTTGMVEVSVNHPLWALKTRQQAKYPFTLNPAVLYQGFWAHAASSVPVDTLQITVSRMALDHLFAGSTLSLTSQKILAGLLGGCCAGIIACPSEMIMTRQQLGLSFQQALRLTVLEGGYRKIFTAFNSTLIRDAIFCSGFFGGVPLIKEPLKKYNLGELGSSIVAGITSGIATAVLSQPFDTLKTVLQASTTKKTTAQAIREIYKNHGVPGLFDGLSLRITRVVSSVLILGSMNNHLEKKAAEKYNQLA